MEYICTYIGEGASQGYLRVGVRHGADDYRLTVATELAAGLAVGEEIDEARHRALIEADELYRAEIIALRRLAGGDCNERKMIEKLVVADISRRAAHIITEKMVRLGYINEREQLSRLIIRESRASLAGPRKIRAKLRQKGYSASDISSVMASLIEKGELDFNKTRAALIEKKLTRGATYEEKMKLLFKNGY